MKVLYSWLKQFIVLSIPAETLAHRLTMSGVEVTRLEKVAGINGQADDWIFELEVTPNRPDLLSHLGIAREIAFVLGRVFKYPKWLDRETRPFEPKGGIPPVSIENPSDCFRYVGLAIDLAQVGSTPEWMVKRLNHVGLRSIHPVVDATNYCLIELGQPLHAFDLDKLEGPSVTVRRAREGETLVTLDGVVRSLSAEHLVIADAKKPVALAGIMGGKETEVTPSTRRIFLESACFNPAVIRRTARLLHIQTESSYRFERGVDLHWVQHAAFRSARLIMQLAKGEFRGWGQIGLTIERRRPISFSPNRAREILTKGVSIHRQRKILTLLGCQVRPTAHSWKVTPPSWRQDLRHFEDLVEEVARGIGYDRIPASLPALTKELLQRKPPIEEDPQLALEFEIRRILPSAGFYEMMSYSLVSRFDHERLGVKEDQVARIANPIAVDYSELRTTLLVGALQAVARNLNRKAADVVRLFEIGLRYHPNPDQPDSPFQERPGLSLIVAGKPWPRWGAPSLSSGLLILKGAVAHLFTQMGLSVEERIEEKDGAHPFFRLPVVVWVNGGDEVGVAGEIRTDLLTAYGLDPDPPVAYAELNLDTMLKGHKSALKVEALAKIPPVVRDMAIVVDENVPYAALTSLIRSAGQPLLKDVSLFDLYRGKQIPPKTKSLAFRLLFSCEDRTLTDEEVAETQNRILSQLAEAFHARLR